MADRLDYFFRQKVTEAELDLGFDLMENADFDFAKDIQFVGAVSGLVVTEHSPTADLTVDISAPGVGYDKTGQRMFVPSLENVDASQDENAVPTTVATPGNERIVSVFIQSDRDLSDPRIDGNSNTVFFRRDLGFKFAVTQGAEATAGTAVPPPLRTDAVLLGDITLDFGKTQIFTGDFDTSRRERAIPVGSLILASDIQYSGGPDWADGTSNPGVNVEIQLDKIIADLSTGSGGKKIAYDGGVDWKDATTNPPTTVGDQLDKFLTDLVDNAGAARIGTAARTAWLGGRTNPTGVSIFAAIDKIIIDLIDQTASDDGAERVGTEAAVSGTKNLAVGSVRSQLNELLSLVDTEAINVVTVGDGSSTFGQFNGTDEVPIDAATAELGANGGIVFVKAGTYTFANIISIPTNVVIVGQSRASVIFDTGSRLTGALVTMSGNNAGLENVQISGPAQATLNIVLMSGNDNHLFNVEIDGDTNTTDESLVHLTGDDNRVTRCSLSQSGTGVKNPIVAFVGGNRNVLEDSFCEHTVVGSSSDNLDLNAIDLRDGDGHKILRNRIEFVGPVSSIILDQRAGIGHFRSGTGSLGTFLVRNCEITGNLIKGGSGAAASTQNGMIGIRIGLFVTSAGATCDHRFERNVIRDNIVDGNVDRILFGISIEVALVGVATSVFQRTQRNVMQGNMSDDTFGVSMQWKDDTATGADTDLVGNCFVGNRVDNGLSVNGIGPNGQQSVNHMQVGHSPSDINMQQTTIT